MRFRRRFTGIVAVGMLALAIGACAATPSSQDPGGSPLTDRLNAAMSTSSSGVLMRVPDNETSPLVSSTLLRDDILVPSMLFNDFDNCNGAAQSVPGWDGYAVNAFIASSEAACAALPFGSDQAYRFPFIAQVVDQESARVPVAAMYPTDADTENRCEEASTVACPGKASILYGSGRGCVYYQVVGSPEDRANGCQCPVGVSGAAWVDGLLQGAEPVEPYTYFRGNDPSTPWFEPGGATGKIGMQTFIDASACWTDDVSQLASYQSAMWLKRFEWWNGLAPSVPEWAADPATSSDPAKASSIYLGWNEVLVDRLAFEDSIEATVIVLPSGAQSLDDLDSVEISGFAYRVLQKNRYGENNLALLRNPIVLLRQVSADGGKTWTRSFFTQSFDFRPYGIPAVLHCHNADTCTMQASL